MICPHCNSEVKINYGRTKNNKQRYKCSSCKRTFMKPWDTYTKTEKRLLSMFVNFLEAIPTNCNTKYFLSKLRNEYNPKALKINIKQRCSSFGFNIHDAKIVICQSNDEVTLYKINPKIASELESMAEFLEVYEIFKNEKKAGRLSSEVQKKIDTTDTNKTSEFCRKAQFKISDGFDTNCV